MKAILPLEVRYIPITKLALINFEKNPDNVYCGLELQYVDGDPLGKGFRVIAYRRDKWVDVYDEKTLKFIPNEKFDVTQKGLKQHVQTQFESTCFDVQNGNVHMSFTFTDCDNRRIEVDILEHAKKKSIPMNLLAPIGVGAESPTFLPVFFLYDFDFVRRGKTDIKVLIDGEIIKLDPFPFPIPMNMQWRYYTRYSMDSQIVEFLNSDSKKVRSVELNEEKQYIEEAVEYQFADCNGDMALSEIQIRCDKHPLKVAFEPPVSLESHNGKFHIIPDPQMGSIDGSYQVTKQDENIRITVVADKGWTVVPNSTVTKMILGEKSVFGRWSKKYIYEQKININDLCSEANWINGNVGSKKG